MPAAATSARRSQPVKDELQQLALANEKIKAFVEGKQIAKLFVVPDRAL
jgi:leucyl-tRNA synthetase